MYSALTWKISSCTNKLKHKKKCLNTEFRNFYSFESKNKNRIKEFNVLFASCYNSSVFISRMERLCWHVVSFVHQCWLHWDSTCDSWEEEERRGSKHFRWIFLPSASSTELLTIWHCGSVNNVRVVEIESTC